MIATLPKTYYNKNHEKQHSKEKLMKKIKKLTSLLFSCLFLYLLAFPGQVQAASLTPTAQDNLSVKLRRSSDLISISNGYMRVFRKTNSVGIEYYDNSLQITDKREIPMELPLWGGFYAGSDGYYLVEGQNNTAEDNSAEVIRVIRYDTNWNRSGAASITSNPDLFGGEVRYPFDYGCVEMTETNGTLYIVTGHEGYVDESVGQGHQGFLMIAVDQASMTGKIVSCDLWHSFAQYIKSQSSYLYVLEQSEGSRCTQLSRYDSSTLDKKTIELLPYGGSRTSVWALNCYASVDGMAVSADSVLCIGTTIDQSQYDNVTSDTPHNIYLTITPVSDFSKEATSVKYLTNYTGNGKSFMGVKITPITENRFMISWEEYESQVAAMVAALKQGQVRKMVLSRTITLQERAYEKAAVWYTALADRYPEAFVFLVFVPGKTCWLGATPEIFLRQSAAGTETMALAGTRRVGTSGAWGQKEIEEQAIVTEYMAELLETVCGEKWRRQGPFSKQAGRVEHLCTVFQHVGKLTPGLTDRVRRALHPTPAVGGVPAGSALPMIRRIEGRNRRYYAGYVGPVSGDGCWDWFVNLRSMELWPDRIRLHIGGGITALSDPRKEWEETELKSRTLLDIVQYSDK